MNEEFSSLPSEIRIYRSIMKADYLRIKTPEIVRRYWRDEIEPSKIYGLGEEGARIFLKKHRNLSEKNLICFARQAETYGHIEMENGFWKQAYLKSLSPKKEKSKSNKIKQIEKEEKVKPATNFQEFWFTLLREQRKYSCYSIFLGLPSDKETMRYLTEYRDDLQIISNSTTLVMTTGSDKFLHVDINGESLSIEIDYEKITRMFGADYAMFPCMVVFEGLSSSNRVHIILNGMTAEEIFEKMKMIFSIIQKSVREKKSPLEAIQQHKNDERLKYAGKTVIGAVNKIVGHTYTTIIQELTKIYAPK